MSFIPYFFIVSFVCLIAVAFTNQAAIIKRMDDWQLLPKPERLTELYFTDDKLLPEAVRQNTPQKVTFTVHNLEHRTTTYHYKFVVSSEDTKTIQPLDDGTLSLTHDQSQTIDKTIKVPPIGRRVMVKVNLEYIASGHNNKASFSQNQSIYFWTKIVGLRA